VKKIESDKITYFGTSKGIVMEDNKINIGRKNFLKKGALLASTSLIAACGGEKVVSEKVDTSKKYKWKMVTTWPPNFPVLGEGCVKFAKLVDEMSLGQMTIKVYGGGELIPPLEVFDAVSGGAAEIGHGASYYWAGKSPAAQFFTTVPFRMNAHQMNAWLYSGGGIELWRELYAKFGLVPFAGGNSGIQMGGWFNRAINSIDDFKGLKMRIPGLGGKVIEKLGGSAVLSAASEIYTNLERGVIDATEWIGPYHDYNMGFHEIAKYYYAPGWHETGSNLEFMFNKREFDNLPLHLQKIIEVATTHMNLTCLSEFEAKNNEYLQKIINDKSTEVRVFPKEVIQALKKVSRATVEEVAQSDEFCKKVFESYDTFHKGITEWSKYSEKLFYSEIDG